MSTLQVKSLSVMPLQAKQHWLLSLAQLHAGKLQTPAAPFKYHSGTAGRAETCSFLSPKLP
jgi:hypothetical protein